MNENEIVVKLKVRLLPDGLCDADKGGKGLGAYRPARFDILDGFFVYTHLFGDLPWRFVT